MPDLPVMGSGSETSASASCVPGGTSSGAQGAGPGQEPKTSWFFWAGWSTRAPAPPGGRRSEP